MRMPITRTRPATHSKTQKITLIVLGLALAGTVFLLPRFVSEPWVAGDMVELPAVPEASPSAVLPSTAAELTRYRQESQRVLAEIVVIRDQLRERNVERWADIDFQQALEMIEVGDERYSFGDYQASLEQFRLARARLGSIEELGRQKLADAKANAEGAIESLNLNVASTSIELATAMAPEDPDVQQLAARVGTLAQVAAHIEAGDQAMARDSFQTAQAEFRKALDLDPSHRRAAKSLALASTEVTAGAFRGHMSRGFAELENQNYDGARSAFLAAGKIYPGNTAVETALAQVENRESGTFVRSELDRALSLESREQWQEAVSIYETLLEEDPSLVDARVRLIPARVRAELDKQLNAYIEEPLRLSAKAEYRTAQEALENARGIANPGQRLSGQITSLDSLLKVANSAVDVVFQSDNQTHVVLFRVADLGRFQQVSVKLRPGKYVAAGTRSGYRDVRVEFTVTGEPIDEPIAVRCEEPIG
jgi:tetratricopeptide (TPR) repeat protein